MVEGRRERRRPRNAEGLEGTSNRERGRVGPGGGGRSIQRLIELGGDGGVGLGGGGWARHRATAGEAGRQRAHKKPRADLDENTRRAYEN